MKYLVKKDIAMRNGPICQQNCPPVDLEGCSQVQYCPFPDGIKTIPAMKKRKK